MRPFIAWTIAGTAILLIGSKLHLDCRLYNNTGTTIAIVQQERNGSSASLEATPSSSVLLKRWIWATYQVSSPQGSWRYQPIDPGSGFSIHRGFLFWRSREFRAQLEPDGRILALPRDQEPPVAAAPHQPRGFPLRPLEAAAGL